ncbi:MAG TPA: hypothetical protein VJN21_12020 [Candidatus Acidoferrales bacterium]|nr:hypothetical protein [Candidatus Acidoferrales bacterium]
MRKWGIVVTVCYFLILIVFLLPAALTLIRGDTPFMKEIADYLTHWQTWATFAVVVGGQALLLFVSVDTPRKRLKPRTHIMVSVIVAGMFLSMLAYAAIWSVYVAIRGDKFDIDVGPFFALWGLLWLIWAIVFYLFNKNSSEIVTRATSWLLRGSALELIIAVVSHVIVRRRNDCSAPVVTGFGIVTGIAIMLLSFGPSVLFLLNRRMDERVPRGRNPLSPPAPNGNDKPN